ncbi:hypothetical protein V1318_10840 [Lysobacter sp. CCNWLW3]|uniref:hypothetical protein n=1 Tax=unclassified Lysobacter TaxID=2635362 RepID=UPI002FCF0060
MKRGTKPLNISDVGRWTMHSQETSAPEVFRDRLLKPTSQIYHRLEWGYAKQIFEHARLRLSPVNAWPDPYEKWCYNVFKQAIKEAPNINAYAMCFTSSRYDEPAWRFIGYEKSEPIVRIRCRVSDLLTAATNSLSSQPGKWLIGAVQYCPERRFRMLASSPISEEMWEPKHVHDAPRAAASTLLLKRRAFRFEKEVRLIFIDQSNSTRQSEIFLPIDPAIISDVMVSPHNNSSFPMIREELMRFGWKPRRSGVLKPPAWMCD